MRYLFWNTNRKNGINRYLRQLIKKYNPDIIGLAEYIDNENELISELKKNGMIFYGTPSMGSRIVTLSRFKNDEIKHRKEGTHFVVKGYPYNDGELHNVVFVHLPSKREDHGGRRSVVLETIREEVKDSDRNVIIGDFNMNPYEMPMISVREMNAIPTAEIARKGTRRFVEKVYPFYYNPMWNFLGDRNVPQGTHYYSTSEEESIYWNLFDQVIVSSSFVDDVHVDDIKIIDTLDEIAFNKKGKPNPSDHFPIYCELRRKES